MMDTAKNQFLRQMAESLRATGEKLTALVPSLEAKHQAKIQKSIERAYLEAQHIEYRLDPLNVPAPPPIPNGQKRKKSNTILFPQRDARQ